MEQPGASIQPLDPWNLLVAHMTFFGRVNDRANLQLAALELEMKSFLLLDALGYLSHPAELARHLMMPKPTVSYFVKRLEAAGYLTRKSVPDDLRRFRLALTASGRRAVRDGRTMVAHALSEQLKVLTPEEQGMFAVLAAKLNPAG